jgi:hypothetical protein
MLFTAMLAVVLGTPKREAWRSQSRNVHRMEAEVAFIRARVRSANSRRPNALDMANDFGKINPEATIEKFMS